MTAVPHRLTPARALLHPLWWSALALLVLNDHVLKGAGVLPGWLTGKLSDVAGLLFAPALLATLACVRSRHGLFVAHAAIAIVFAAIKLSPAAASAFEGLMALGPLPWAITVDPSDLLALPALVLSWRLARATMTAPSTLRSRRALPRTIARPLTGALLGAGVVASLATSPPPEDFFPSVEADLVLGADAATATLILRIRALRSDVVIDCAGAERDPTRAFSRDLFGPALGWEVDPGRVIQVRGDGVSLAPVECTAVLVDGTLHRGDPDLGDAGEPIPMTLVFWRGDAFPPALLTSTTADVEADRFLKIVTTVSGPRFAPHTAVFPAPPEIAETPVPGCEGAPEGGFVDWQREVPTGAREIVAVDTAPDGCHRFIFAGSGAWYLCTGTTAMPFAAGDRVHLSTATIGQAFESAEVVSLLGEGDAADKRLVAARGGDLAPWGEGTWSASPLRECRTAVGACGSTITAQALRIDDGARVTPDVVPGDALPVGTGTLLVLRAERGLVADRACMPLDPDTGLALESVFYAPASAPEE